MSVPAITIGIMTHNYGRYIREAIESVLTQSRTDWELIISDDASTDDTAEIVAPYLSDARIRYVRHETNLGQGGNWGYLLEQGTAPILAVLHADDAWLPETLAVALSAFEADAQLDLFYGNWWRKEDGQNTLTLAKNEKAHVLSGHEEYRYQVKRNTWLPSATFITRRVVKAVGLPIQSLRVVVDQEYFLRVVAVSRRAQATGIPLMVYRCHSENASAHRIANGLFVSEMEQLPALCASHVSKWPDAQKCLSALRFGIACSTFSIGKIEAMSGNVDRGLDLMYRSIKISSLILLNPKRMMSYILCRTGSVGRALFYSLLLARQGLKQDN